MAKVKTGRPKAVIDWDKVDKLLQAQCNGTGIAGLLGIHPDTLYDACVRDKKTTFSDYSQQKRNEGQELLRSKQFAVAMGGDKAMLIWLGKQYLNQKDRTDVTSENDQIFPAEILHLYSQIAPPPASTEEDVKKQEGL